LGKKALEIMGPLNVEKLFEVLLDVESCILPSTSEVDELVEVT
jgi:hypothetical protein